MSAFALQHSAITTLLANKVIFCDHSFQANTMYPEITSFL